MKFYVGQKVVIKPGVNTSGLLQEDNPYTIIKFGNSWGSGGPCLILDNMKFDAFSVELFLDAERFVSDKKFNSAFDDFLKD